MKLENNWQYKSLFNLAKIDLGSAADAPTPLVKKCCELISKPLNQYTTENLRLMIGQEIGLDYLMPVAIHKLTDNLFAEGDMYEGDLLSNVLNVNPIFWIKNALLHSQLNEIVVDKRNMLTELGISIKKFDNLPAN